ncbi:response regulator transcription factor [Aurantivibrio plasticivorans]
MNDTETPTVAIVEDNQATRERLAEVIFRSNEFHLSGVAQNCAEARQLIADTKPRVLLVDLGLPDGSGIDLIKETQALSPKSEIVVITIFGDEKHVVSAIEAGASGYLLKDHEANHILNSIRQLLDGGSPISPSIARHLLKRFRAPTDNNGDDEAPKLTSREEEVLNLVAKGFTYAEIGNMLTMSTHTVTSHVKHIYRKLSVNSRGQAVFEAMQLGLIDRPH